MLANAARVSMKTVASHERLALFRSPVIVGTDANMWPAAAVCRLSRSVPVSILMFESLEICQHGACRTGPFRSW